MRVAMKCPSAKTLTTRLLTGVALMTVAAFASPRTAWSQQPAQAQTEDAEEAEQETPAPAPPQAAPLQP